MKKLSILFSGAAMCLALAFPIVVFAQNHNPEFETSDFHISVTDANGNVTEYDYVIIPPDEDATPVRTNVEMKYRDGNIPTDGKTELSWQSGDKIDVYESGATDPLDLMTHKREDGNQGEKDLELEAHIGATSGNSQVLEAKYTDTDNNSSPIGEREFTLLKVEIGSDPSTGPEEFRNKYIHRFKPERNWGNGQEREDLARNEPLYAGDGTGDQVCYKGYIPGINTSIIINYRWWAEGEYEYSYITQNITGPEGVDEDQWLIDADNLDWTPGKYSINLEVTFPGGGIARAEYKQEIGWRTPEVVAIGQIVETGQYSLATLPEEDLRRALIDTALDTWSDINGWIDWLPTISSVRDAMIDGVATSSNPEWTLKCLEFLGAATFIQDFDDIPQGPLSNTLGVADLYAIQELLNANNDSELSMPSSFQESFIEDTILDSDNLLFRVFTRFQADLLVDENFLIKEGKPTIQFTTQTVVSGFTKLGLFFPEGLFFDGVIAGINVKLPPFDIPIPTQQIAPDDNSSNGIQGPTSMGYSLYGSARIGEAGQKLNWAILGRDAPWIWVESIAYSDTIEYEIKMKYSTSVDVWLDGQAAISSGVCPFNEIMFYERDYSSGQYPFNQLGTTLPMLGHLDCFVKSASLGVRPAPESTPYVE